MYKDYIKDQFKKVSTNGNGIYSPKIKIIKPNNETDWIIITEKQLKKIKEILTK